MELLKKTRKAAVLFFILGATLFLATVIVFVMDYALVEMRLRVPVVYENKIRHDAYNAFYAAMAELKEYTTIDGSLYSPKQGWGSLLADGRARLPEGLTCKVEIVDETGKLPLPVLKESELEDLFYEIGFTESDASVVSQLLLDWVDSDDSARLQGAEKDDYDVDAAVPPNRMLRSFDELRYVKDISKYFFSEDGQPNETYEKFVSAVSILNTTGEVNFNTASELVLRALYKMDDIDFDNNIFDAISGDAAGVRDGITWVTQKTELENRGATLPLRYVGVSARILSIYVSVSRGVSKFTLTAVCSVSGNSITVNSLIEGGRRK